MRHPFLLLLSLLFLGLFTSTLCAQKVSKITTVEGEVYQGEILVETVDTVTMRSTSGADISIPRTSIGRIEYNYSAEKDLNKGFWAFGATFGTPAGLNLVLGYNFNNDWGLRFTAGYIGAAAGLQLDGTYRIGGSSVRHNLNLGLGTSTLDGGSLYGVREWTYLEGGYNMQIGGFDLMLGLSAGSGDFTNPQLLFQIGYVHRFRD